MPLRSSLGRSAGDGAKAIGWGRFGEKSQLRRSGAGPAIRVVLLGTLACVPHRGSASGGLERLAAISAVSLDRRRSLDDLVTPGTLDQRDL